MDKILCNMCSRSFSDFRCLGIHIKHSHNISTEEYYCKYIGNVGSCKHCSSPTNFINLNKGYSGCCGGRCAKLLAYSDPEYRENVSRKTKLAMSETSVKKKMEARRGVPRTAETKEKISNSSKGKFERDPSLYSRIYTDERNKKISESKILFWKNNESGKKRVGEIWKTWKNRDEVGWRKHLLNASIKGFKVVFSPNGDTSLETKVYGMMDEEKINYIKKYELCGKVYDALLTDYNILLEIDGDFWHKQTIESCKYEFQKKAFFNDIEKNEIAIKNNFKILRILEKNLPKTVMEAVLSV